MGTEVFFFLSKHCAALIRRREGEAQKVVHADSIKSQIINSFTALWHQKGVVTYVPICPFSYWAKLLEGKKLGIFSFQKNYTKGHKAN